MSKGQGICPKDVHQSIHKYTRPSHLKRFILKIVPNFCLLCKDYSADYLCDGCLRSLTFNAKHSDIENLPITEQVCGCCSIALTTKSSVSISRLNRRELCAECIQNPPAFDSSICTLKYAYPANALIHKFKYGNDEHLGRFLSKLLIKDIQTKLFGTEKSLSLSPVNGTRHRNQQNTDYCIPQVIIPVPTHWHKRFTRKFNASLFIANEISKATRIPILNMFNKTKNTAAQHTLNKKQRRKNLNGSFSINPKLIHKLQSNNIEHVAIIDDVLTTGTTANLLANQLKGRGIKTISVWALARTPKPS